MGMTLAEEWTLTKDWLEVRSSELLARLVADPDDAELARELIVVDRCLDYVRRDDPTAKDAYDRPGLPNIKALPDYMRELERKKRGISNQLSGEDSGSRHRRLFACREVGELITTIEAMPISELKRSELTNLAKVLLRMILIENDGQVSISTLQGF